MFETPQVMRMAQELARHSGTRQSVVATNMANADTPGYQARDLDSFSNAFREGAMAMRATRADHMTVRGASLTARMVEVGGEASPNGNTVSLEQEMMRAAKAQSDHTTALTVYRTSLDIMRAALGRVR